MGKQWPYSLFGAALFLFFATSTLAAGPTEWYSVVTVVVAYAAAVIFAVRAFVDYRREREVASSDADRDT